MTMELDHEELLLNALKERLPRLARMSTKQALAAIGQSNFDDILDHTYNFLKQACGSMPLTKNEEAALLFQCFRCLADYITNTMKIPFTLKTLIDSIYLLSFAVNEAFPGYAAAGLLKAVILPSKLQKLAS